MGEPVDGRRRCLPAAPAAGRSDAALGQSAGRPRRPRHERNGSVAVSWTGPFITHVHGGHTPDESDGYPEAWYLPAASNIPAGFARSGTWYSYFNAKFKATWGGDWEPGSATSVYPNNQRATTLWYHDHTLGMTRLNMYAGAAGFYLIRGGATDLPSGTLPGPAPAVGDATGTSCYEIPIIIQDRSFNADGSLFYPDNRAFFEGLHLGQLQIPFIPQAGCTEIGRASCRERV